jgi:hypothetical protein
MNCELLTPISLVIGCSDIPYKIIDLLKTSVSLPPALKNDLRKKDKKGYLVHISPKVASINPVRFVGGIALLPPGAETSYAIISVKLLSKKLYNKVFPFKTSICFND